MIGDILPFLIPVAIFIAHLIFRNRHSIWRGGVAGLSVFLLGWPIAVVIDHFINHPSRETSFWLYPTSFFFVGLIILFDNINIRRKNKGSRQKSGTKNE